MVAKAAARLAPEDARSIEAELHNLPITRRTLAAADRDARGCFSPTDATALTYLQSLHRFVAAVDAVQATFNAQAVTVFQVLYVAHGRTDAAAAAAGISPRTTRRIRSAIVTAIAERLGCWPERDACG
jgi:hypothetical protein